MTTTISTRKYEAHERLRQAFQTGTPCAPVRDLLGEDLDSAYQVQELGIAQRVLDGATRVGRKVGLTSTAVQEQLGVDEPDFGVLLDKMRVGSDGQIPYGTLIAPRIEAEIAFIMGSDVTDPTPERVRAAIGYASPSLEIVDSRIRDWDITIVDTVADNASNGLFILGEERVSLDEFEPREATMKLTANGELVSNGNGAACLGDPLNAVVWVAQTAARLGRPLRAGEIVLSGALGPMVPLRPGVSIEAEISGLGTVQAQLLGE